MGLYRSRSRSLLPTSFGEPIRKLPSTVIGKGFRRTRDRADLTGEVVVETFPFIGFCPRLRDKKLAQTFDRQLLRGGPVSTGRLDQWPLNICRQSNRRHTTP